MKRPVILAAAAVALPVPAAAEGAVLRPALASWYGPSLWGNPLGCGGTLWPATRGVAHKTLPCGTRLRICARRCRSTRVIDRGPYVGNREFDLTMRFAAAVGFGGVGVIRVRVLRDG